MGDRGHFDGDGETVASGSPKVEPTGTSKSLTDAAPAASNTPVDGAERRTLNLRDRVRPLVHLRGLLVELKRRLNATK